MRQPTASQIEVARRLFALEAHGIASAEDRAAAAGRIHAKLFARLASLVGADGAHALLARSLKVAAAEFPCLGNVHFDADESEPLVNCLRAEPPAVVTEATVALCATLLSLLETLIGERITANIVRSVWPNFDVTNEETK